MIKGHPGTFFAAGILKAYVPLDDGVSPACGTDIKGMGAVIKSVSHIPHGRFTQGTLLNAKLDTSFSNGPGSTVAMMNFLKSMCTLGVFHVQFDVIDAETLCDAQAHSEDYNGLLVRVAGYTAYFAELGRETQDAWCSTPESQNCCAEVYYQAEKCTLCGLCVRACPAGVLSLDAGAGRIARDPAKCTQCAACVRACLAMAQGLYDGEMTVKEIMKLIHRDEVFYFHSGGGVTFSGGNVLIQRSLSRAC